MFSYSTGYYVSPPDDQYLKFKNRCSLLSMSNMTTIDFIVYTWMISIVYGWDLAVWMRSSRVWKEFSRLARASDCQCQSRNSRGFDPSVLRHSGTWGAADEAVLKEVHKKYSDVYRPSEPYGQDSKCTANADPLTRPFLMLERCWSAQMDMDAISLSDPD